MSATPAGRAVTRFNLTRLEAVVSGRGAVDVLGPEMDARGAGRVLVTTTRSLVGSPSLERMRSALGARFVGVAVNAGQHAPAEGVRSIAAELEKLEADAVVSLGAAASSIPLKWRWRRWSTGGK